MLGCSSTTTTLNFAYDASGLPMAVTYNGTTYYYVTNLQGDVVAILDNTGNAVVKYIYDAWGKLLTTSGTLATTLGVHNPLRYRGYVYDPEYGLYYLQSRYYDPYLGRFINADAFASTGKNPLDCNMFAYCGNNPIMGYDPTGTIDWGTFAEGAGLMSVGVTAIIVAAAVVSGGACVPLLIAAGATFAAGGMTLANQMLWEAIKRADVQIIAQETIVAFLFQQRTFFVLPEPLPAIINHNSFEYVCVDLDRDKFDICGLFEQEPMYIIDCKFKWMIVLTTENTRSGTQLCVLVYSK